MENKKEAERAEARLLGVFDYAWNKDRNSARRPSDILRKLDKTFSEPAPFSRIRESIQHWNWRDFRRKREGITISPSKPVKETESNLNHPECDLDSQIFKFGRSRPRLITGDFDVNKGLFICGVVLGDGTVCTNTPIAGRKRCSEHKGKRVNGFVEERDVDIGSWIFKFDRLRPSSIIEKCFIKEDEYVCGVALGDGTVCRNSPVAGRKRCNEHKGKRINGLVAERNADLGLPTLKFSINEDEHVCGVALGDGTVCRNSPVAGRKRCNEHKGKRINGFVAERNADLGFPTLKFCINENQHVCGVILGDGTVCRNSPVAGRKRCNEHKGKRINGLVAERNADLGLPTLKFSVNEHQQVCGVILGDGTVCRNSPVAGRKRCSEHKGKRIYG